jgi:Xaa-Pro dipeptidase
LDRRFSFPAASRAVREVAREFPGAEIVCSEDGPDAFIEELRLVKDAEEIRRLRAAAGILNTLVDGMERALRNGGLRSEIEAALYIESECRRLGAEGTSFDTIAAGPDRSFGIHAFPNYGPGPFAAPGLSILDFGVTFEGYAGDVTLTVVAGKQSPRRRLLVDLVEEAYAAALELCGPGVPASRIAAAADRVFARHGLAMPHSLGHGLGIQVHEAPYLRSSPEKDAVLRPGMVFTLEPGLYDPEAGGVRLENDILITETGREVLTTSRILHI